MNYGGDGNPPSAQQQNSVENEQMMVLALIRTFMAES